MRPTRDCIENLLIRIQNDFLDRPTLALTSPEAQKRFGIDERTCAGVFDALVDARVLAVHEGTYRKSFHRFNARRAA
jgi:hypothetical protein